MVRCLIFFHKIGTNFFFHLIEGDGAPNNKLFVANLTYNVSLQIHLLSFSILTLKFCIQTRQRDLEDIFSKYGKVAEVHIAGIVIL